MAPPAQPGSLNLLMSVTLHRPLRSLRFLGWAALSAMLAAVPVRAAAPDDARDAIRLGFTYAMFYGVNENDAKAAMRSLATEFSRQSGLKAEYEPHLYDTFTAMADGIRHGEVNYVGLTTEEFAAVQTEVSFDRFMCSATDGDPTETYLVLVHRHSSLPTLAELRDRHLAIAPGPRMSLASLWLDVELTRAGHAASGNFFSRQTTFTKPAKAVLAVFFKQADACLVTRRLFDTMVELNPQLATQLQVLATSPGYVPCLFAFVADFPAALKEKSVREFSRVHESTTGRQILMMFQTQRTAGLARADLDPSLALVAEHARRCPEASARRRAQLLNPRGFDESPP